MKRKNIYLTFLLDFAVIAAMLAGPYFLGLLMDGVSNCWSLEMGLICPACGGTRSLMYILRGDFLSALKFNPMVVFVFLYLFALLISLNLSVFTKLKFPRKAKKLLIHPYSIICVAAAFVLFGVLRNVFFRDMFLAILI